MRILRSIGLLLLLLLLLRLLLPDFIFKPPQINHQKRPAKISPHHHPAAASSLSTTTTHPGPHQSKLTFLLYSFDFKYQIQTPLQRYYSIYKHQMLVDTGNIISSYILLSIVHNYCDKDTPTPAHNHEPLVIYNS